MATVRDAVVFLLVCDCFCRILYVGGYVDGMNNEILEFIKAKAHHLPIEDQHWLSAALAAAPTPPGQDDENFVINSVVKCKPGNNPFPVSADGMRKLCQIDGYAIIPLEEYENLTELAQEAEPVAYRERSSGHLWPKSEADQMLDDAVIEELLEPLYTHTPSDKLRQAAEEYLEANVYGTTEDCARAYEKLRAALEGKS